MYGVPHIRRLLVNLRASTVTKVQQTLVANSQLEMYRLDASRSGVQTFLTSSNHDLVSPARTSYLQPPGAAQTNHTDHNRNHCLCPPPITSHVSRTRAKAQEGCEGSLERSRDRCPHHILAFATIKNRRWREF